MYRSLTILYPVISNYPLRNKIVFSNKYTVRNFRAQFVPPPPQVSRVRLCTLTQAGTNFNDPKLCQT